MDPTGSYWKLSKHHQKIRGIVKNKNKILQNVESTWSNRSLLKLLTTKINNNDWDDDGNFASLKKNFSFSIYFAHHIFNTISYWTDFSMWILPTSLSFFLNSTRGHERKRLRTIQPTSQQISSTRNKNLWNYSEETKLEIY